MIKGKFSMFNNKSFDEISFQKENRANDRECELWIYIFFHSGFKRVSWSSSNLHRIEINSVQIENKRKESGRSNKNTDKQV